MQKDKKKTCQDMRTIKIIDGNQKPLSYDGKNNGPVPVKTEDVVMTSFFLVQRSVSSTKS